MRNNIIDDLRSYYLDQNIKIRQLLKNETMRQICDLYFKDRLSYHEIARFYNMSINEVSRLMKTACGFIIRNRYEHA